MRKGRRTAERGRLEMFVFPSSFVPHATGNLLLRSPVPVKMFRRPPMILNCFMLASLAACDGPDGQSIGTRRPVKSLPSAAPMPERAERAFRVTESKARAMGISRLVQRGSTRATSCVSSNISRKGSADTRKWHGSPGSSMGRRVKRSRITMPPSRSPKARRAFRTPQTVMPLRSTIEATLRSV